MLQGTAMKERRGVVLIVVDKVEARSARVLEGECADVASERQVDANRRVTVFVEIECDALAHFSPAAIRDDGVHSPAS